MGLEPLRLLVVSEDDAQAARLQELLRQALGARTDARVCHGVPGLRRALHERDIDCLVLGLSQPGESQMLDVVLASVSDEPVVVLASEDQPEVALRAIEEGAQDYLPEPAADPDTVRRSIHHAIARKHTDARLARQALHDPLTGLPNRALMLDRLNLAVARSRRRPMSLALLFLDLDGFKSVNDSLGHEAGDDVLVEVAARLQRVLRPGDTVARYGGDEFVILCEELRSQREAVRVAERARAAIAEPFELRGREFTLQASVGIARARRSQARAQDLVREADAAMYQAKRRGSGVELYETTHELEVESRLRDAVQLTRLQLHYQPVVALADDVLHSVEALVRWEHPERGLLLPAEFLALAEEIGVIAQIDEWVLREACAQRARWRAAGVIGDHVPVSVNLSSASLRSPELGQAVQRGLADAGLAPRCLSLEVTESSLERDPMRAATVLDDLGVRLGLDDFGTDRSTIGALAGHRFDTLKIGGATSGRTLAMVLGAAHAAGIETVAKGVETADELQNARNAGCDAAQGFILARPAPADEIERWLLSRQ